MTADDDDGHGADAFMEDVDAAVERALEEGTCGGCMVGVLLATVASLIVTEFHDDRAEMERQVRLCAVDLRSSMRELVAAYSAPLH